VGGLVIMLVWLHSCHQRKQHRAGLHTCHQRKENALPLEVPQEPCWACCIAEVT
jgi:hypothetical protein